MNNIAALVADNIDVWTGAIIRKSAAGRGFSKNIRLYGIDRLRALILDLAVRGKLVQQDARDEFPPAFLKLPTVEIPPPFPLPNNWTYLPFGEALDIQGGGQPPKSKFSDIEMPGYVQLIQIRDLGPKPQPVYVERSLVTKFCKETDIMIGRYGASVGKVFWGRNGAYNVALIKVIDDKNLFHPPFLFQLLKSPYGKSFFFGASRSAQAGFNKKDLAKYILPIPPIAEQMRIVAKVDELMALCDALEWESESALAAHQTLVETLLATLKNSTDAADLATNWARLETHFDTLFTTESSIDALKQTILDLSVRGKLVPQVQKEEPAFELLKRVKSARLLADGVLKKSKSLATLEDAEKPYELPANWLWVRVAEIFQVSSGGTFPASSEREEGVVPYLKVADMNLPQNDVWISTSSRFIDPDIKQVRGLIQPNSIIFPKRGGAIATNKKRLVSFPIFVDLNIMALTVPSELSLSFAYVWLLGKDLALLNTGTSVPQINHQDIDPLAFPLPPFPEQKRIVAKVDELMTLCEQLKSHLADASEIQRHLADAITQKATA
jgi:type I restriction enzyme S subunit